MLFESILESLKAALGDSLPRILGALVVLVAGWLVAVLVRAAVRRSLSALQLNRRVGKSSGHTIDLEGGIAKGGFFVILVLALIAFFNILRLSLVSAPLESLVSQVLDYLPQLVAGGVLMLVAWIVATVVRNLTAKALAATSLDEKLSVEAGMQPMSSNLAGVLYGLVLLLFLPAVLGVLGLQGLLEPVQAMLDEILGMLPNFVAALALGLVGWFVARLLRDLVTNLAASAGADQLGARAGLTGKMTLSRLAGVLVFVFVFVPALVLGLEALKLEAVSRPATEMLGAFMAAVPKLFAATAILTITWYVARFVAEIVTSLLAGIGFDGLPAKLGVGIDTSGAAQPSRVVGRLIVFFAMLFATVEAAAMLGFLKFSELVTTAIEFAGQVLLGVAIIAVGLWLSSLAHAALTRVERANAALVATIARVAILGIVFAMGLRAMGIADEIVNLAFALTLGSIAVAVALSFGLGGREAAGRQMEHWLSRLRGDQRS